MIYDIWYIIIYNMQYTTYNIQYTMYNMYYIKYTIKQMGKCYTTI